MQCVFDPVKDATNRAKHGVSLGEAVRLDGSEEWLCAMALDQQAGSRMVIVVAHRLSSVERADHVILLDHGRVAATGSPDELWRGSPLFRALFGAERRSA